MSNVIEPLTKIISKEILLFPLYKKIKIDGDTLCSLFFPNDSLKVECYCNKCKQRRIFTFQDSAFGSSSIGTIHSTTLKLIGVTFFDFFAKADCGHKMGVYFTKIDDDTVMKVGQFPSIYDLDEEINNKLFLKEMGSEYADYYKKACSLYGFGSCIGALVYLRRIFEKLLIDTFNEHEEELGITPDDFEKKRMEDKIKILKDFLPSIMQEQGFNKIYTKISDGIHNLDELECSNIFIALKQGIEEIIIEKIDNKEKEFRQKEISKLLQSVGHE